MNKRHYEHTLPNIRGSLSNTYGISGIGPEEIDLIIDLCNGKDIPTDKRLSLLRAIHHIKDTQIERSILESINGSDSRISKFLDEAEHLNEATSDSD